MGGAIFMKDIISLLISYSHFRNNFAKEEGGGIYLTKGEDI